MMDGLIRKHIRHSIDEYLNSESFDNVVLAALRRPRFRYFWFIKAMQARLMEADKAMTGKRAWYTAAGVYRQFLKDEKVKFGDPRFAWDRDAARTLIEEYEIHYWDEAA